MEEQTRANSFIWDKDPTSKNTYRSILGYDKNPLTSNNPNGWVKAYLDSVGVISKGNDAMRNAINQLGYNIPAGISIDEWASKQDSNFQQDFLNRIGLNTVDKKIAFIEKQLVPSSGITAEMRNKNQNISTVNQSTSTTQPKQSGVKTITSTLNLGSQGDQVKELQNYLSGIGYKGSDGKPLKADGIYGPQTKAAVMEFQSKNGLVADGIMGPKTLAKINEITSTPTQADSTPPSIIVDNTSSSMTDTSNPYDGGTIYNTGDPALDATLKELQNFIKTQQDAGLKINEALNFDQATINKFLETAKKQVSPFYQQQIDNIKQDVIRAIPQVLQNYESEIASKEADFTGALDTSRESAAGSGLAFSGSRAKGEQGMEATQNRNLASLSQTYGNKLYDLGRGAEEKIGASNVDYDIGALKNYRADLAGPGGLTQTGITTPYTKGGYGTGTLEYDREQAIQARKQALAKTASEAVVAGRSYNDLFQ